MHLISTESREQVCLGHYWLPLLAEQLASSVINHFVEVTDADAADATILHQHGIAPALHANTLGICDTTLNIPVALSSFQMPSEDASQAFRLEVILSAIGHDVGDSDGDEGVDLAGVGVSPDGDNAHHESPSTAVVEDLVLILISGGEIGHGDNWLVAAPPDEMFVLAV